MTRESGHLLDWIIPVCFVICAGWVVWHLPAFFLDFVGYADPSKTVQIQDYFDRKQVTPWLNGPGGRNVDIIDWIALALAPVFFFLGVRSIVLNPMEFEDYSKIDRIAMFIGRVTMMLILLMTGVMLYEVFVRYAIEKPTIWANELTLWMAGFIFMLSGFYGMQQRSHIRIFIIYDLMPRWLQHVCDGISVLLVWFFAACLVWGSYSQVFIGKFYNWQTFGTAFDPPLPATVQPIILITIVVVSIQALLNLIADWDKDPNQLLEKDVVDQEELEALKKSMEDT